MHSGKRVGQGLGGPPKAAAALTSPPSCTPALVTLASVLLPQYPEHIPTSGPLHHCNTLQNTLAHSPFGSHQISTHILSERPSLSTRHKTARPITGPRGPSRHVCLSELCLRPLAWPLHGDRDCLFITLS